jgi:hypothetical protein
LAPHSSLGATPRQIGALVLRETMTITLTGGLLGWLLAVGLLTALAPPNKSLNLISYTPCSLSGPSSAADDSRAAGRRDARVRADPSRAG